MAAASASASRFPSNVAKTVVGAAEEHGKVSRGWLGVQIQEVTPAIAASLGLKGEHGALVAVVTAEQPGGQGRAQARRRHPVVQRHRSQQAARPAAVCRPTPPDSNAQDDGLAQRQADHSQVDGRRGSGTMRKSPRPAASKTSEQRRAAPWLGHAFRAADQRAAPRASRRPRGLRAWSSPGRQRQRSPTISA